MILGGTDDRPQSSTKTDERTGSWRSKLEVVTARESNSELEKKNAAMFLVKKQKVS